MIVLNHHKRSSMWHDNMEIGHFPAQLLYYILVSYFVSRSLDVLSDDVIEKLTEYYKESVRCGAYYFVYVLLYSFILCF